MKRGFGTVITIVIVLIALGGGYYLYQQGSGDQDPIACTAEAKLCPDGSSVGRTGPNCEFSECSAEGDVVLEEQNSVDDVEKHNEAYSQFCRLDSDCVIVTEMDPHCTHFCQEEECKEKSIEVCDAYYRYSEGNKNWQNHVCIASLSCKEPSEIECINNTCTTSL